MCLTRAYNVALRGRTPAIDHSFSVQDGAWGIATDPTAALASIDAESYLSLGLDIMPGGSRWTYTYGDKLTWDEIYNDTGRAALPTGAFDAAKWNGATANNTSTLLLCTPPRR